MRSCATSATSAFLARGSGTRAWRLRTTPAGSPNRSDPPCVISSPPQAEQLACQPVRLVLRWRCRDPGRRCWSPRRPDRDQRLHRAAHRLPAGAARRCHAHRPSGPARVHRRACHPRQRPLSGGSRRSRRRARPARGKLGHRYRPAGHRRPATSTRSLLTRLELPEDHQLLGAEAERAHRGRMRALASLPTMAKSAPIGA